MESKFFSKIADSLCADELNDKVEKDLLTLEVALAGACAVYYQT